MCRQMICIIFYSLVLLLKPLCAGSVSENVGELDVEWETKLSLNSSYELGGKVIRSSFPPSFVFGTAGAAYQYEGAVTEDGRGPSIWDVFVHSSPGRIKGDATADVAVDQYHRYKIVGMAYRDDNEPDIKEIFYDNALTIKSTQILWEDIQIMEDLGLDAYRFSISWSRIIPGGRGAINWAGVAYYNRFINKLISKGIEPYVTLYHWDLPQALGVTGGWLDAKIIDAFIEFAELCFKLFGGRVKHWITFNEIHSFAVNGFYSGIDAPGRCSKPFGNCGAGNSTVEPWIVAHNVLIAHAQTVNIYRTDFQDHQKGEIGMTVDGMWFEPCKNNPEDIQAAQSAEEFWVGWFLDPIFFGDYPASMRQYNLALPKFTKEQSEMLKGSCDFVGLNQYTAMFATYDPSSVDKNDVSLSSFCDGVAIGPLTIADWFQIYPHGMRHMLGWIRRRYANPPIYITENGFPGGASEEAHTLNLGKQVQDFDRIRYHHDYMQQMQLGMRDGSDVRGYFAWSLLDNFEWRDGYQIRFGFYNVDFERDLQRTPKVSADWFKYVLGNKNVSVQAT